MQKRPKVSILIVYYREKEELIKCLNSINKSKTKYSFEIIVVDNSSENEIKNIINLDFPKVIYINSPGNIGFGRGNNLGAKYAKGEYLFILNPDSSLYKDTLDQLLKFLLARDGKCVVAPMLYHSDGKKYHLLGSRELTPFKALITLTFINKLFPNNRVSRNFWYETIRTKPYQVEIIPGLFMIKKNLYKKLGGFDEKFFLYFEDTDFSKRIFNLRIPSYILPKAKVVHIGGSGTKRIEKIQEIFSKSRFYFFKKHYGFIWATIIHFTASFSKWTIMLSIILLLGTFLRFYRIQENFIFLGENGLDYLRIKDFIEKGEFPLFGPQTSHEWFSIAPLFYWLFMIVMPLGAFEPITGAYFFAGVGVLAILICYLTLSKVLDRKTALISSYLVAISPLWMHYTRASRYNVVAAYLFFPFIYFLVKAQEDGGKSLFWLGLTLGFMFSFFPSPIVLLPVAIFIIFLKRKIIKMNYLMSGIGGLLIPNIPYIIGIIGNNIDMIINIIQWVPYRILGFVGVYPKNTASSDILKANLFSLYDFFQESFLASDSIIALVLFLSVLSYLYFKLKSKDKNILFWKTLALVFVVSYLGLFLHGDPPEHYYFIVFPVPIILLGSLLADITNKEIGKYLIVIILVTLTYLNTKYYFSNEWFFIPQEAVVDGKLPVPYQMQEKVVDTIIQDAKGRKLSLNRVGELDKFNNDFAQNYIYLLWLKGNQPVREADISYTIYEDTQKLPDNIEGEIFWINNIAIVKSDHSRSVQAHSWNVEKKNEDFGNSSD